MDSINIKLYLKNPTGECIEFKYFNNLKEKLELMRYCDINVKKDYEIINCKLSFPRVFSETNAYLITKKRECKKVIRTFINDILNGDFGYTKWIEENLRIRLTRVDVAVTYIMEEDEEFNDYSNIFSLFEECSRNKVKRFMCNRKVETILIYDGKDRKGSNQKISIYNQAKKFEDLYPKLFPTLLDKFPNLKRRIRIELSQRVNRKEMSISDFRKIDFYDTYVRTYVKKINKILFDEEQIESTWNNQIKLLKSILRKSSEKNISNFIYENIDDIWDYKMLRQILPKTNLHTFYKKCRTGRDILKEIQKKKGVRYFNILRKIDKMKKVCSISKGGR